MFEPKIMDFWHFFLVEGTLAFEYEDILGFGMSTI